MSEKKKKTNAPVVHAEPRVDPHAWRPWGSPWGTRIERFMEHFFDDGLNEFRHGGDLRGVLSPKMDLSEDDSHYTVSVEIPGVEKSDLTVELAERTLTVRGEKKSEREEQKERTRYSERRFGSFSRSLALPADAETDPARIEAAFKDGVLTVRVPRTAEGKPAVVHVK